MNVERRYAIFISSTYIDLHSERQRIIYAAVKKRCAVECMENFPSEDRDKWSVIKEAIDRCQIYVLMISGRYGSVEEETGLSYTEKEFDYAVEKGKYVIVFIKQGYNRLETYKNEPNKSKLDCFVKKAEELRMVSYWSNPDQLLDLFNNSYHLAIKNKKLEGKGWIKESIFKGYKSVFPIDPSDYRQNLQRQSCKINSIENCKELKIIVHTGFYFFSQLGKNIIFECIRKSLEENLRNLQIVLSHPYSLSSILIAQECDEHVDLSNEDIKRLLNKTMEAFPENIEDKLRKNLYDLVNNSKKNHFYERFFHSIEGINKLQKIFPDKVHLKLLPTEATMSLMLTDRDCFIEPYASPIAGDSSIDTCELFIDKNAVKMYNNMRRHFDYIWEISNCYKLEELKEKRTYIKGSILNKKYTRR